MILKSFQIKSAHYILLTEYYFHSTCFSKAFLEQLRCGKDILLTYQSTQTETHMMKVMYHLYWQPFRSNKSPVLDYHYKFYMRSMPAQHTNLDKRQ